MPGGMGQGCRRREVNRSVATRILSNGSSDRSTVEAKYDGICINLGGIVAENHIESAANWHLPAPRGKTFDVRRGIGACDNVQVVDEMFLMRTASAGTDPKQTPRGGCISNRGGIIKVTTIISH